MEIRTADSHTRDVERKAGEFSLLLIKALMQTGTYSSDHPMARNASDEMFTAFKEVTDGVQELTYLLVSTVDDQGILVDGLLPEPIPVVKVFRSMMGDHFIAKFHDYFARNRIASFTIRSVITREDFDTFLTCLTSWAGESSTSKVSRSTEEFSTQLTELGIFDISVVSMDEVVGGKRHLPWPVKIALSRLRKDITKLPMLRDADRSAVQALKVQSIKDVVRPITRVDMIRELLLNADLVADGVNITSTPEVENAIISGLPADAIQAIAESLMMMNDDLGSSRSRLNVVGRSVEDLQETVGRCLARCLSTLSRLEYQTAFNLLEVAYKKQLMPITELPKDLQRRLRAGETTDKFLASASQYLLDFQGTDDARNYIKYLNVFTVVLPELTVRSNRQMVSTIFGILVSHHEDDEQSPFPGRQRFIDEALSRLHAGGFLAAVIQLAFLTPKEEREQLEAGISLFGPTVVPVLINFLTSDIDPTVRATVSAILMRIGDPAVEPLTDELRAHRHNWQAVRVLVRVLGQMAARESVPVIHQYINHPHPKVREECAVALYDIMGADSETFVLELLEDKDKMVARRVVGLLAQMHCTGGKFLSFLFDMIRTRARNEDEPEETVQIMCLRALTEYERVVLPREPDIEGALMDILSESGFRSFLPGRLGRRSKSNAIRVQAVAALAARSGADALEFVEDLTKSQDAEIADAAKAAFARMNSEPQF